MSLRSTLSSASSNTLPSSVLATILEDRLPPGWKKDRQIKTRGWPQLEGVHYFPRLTITELILNEHVVVLRPRRVISDKVRVWAQYGVGTHFSECSSSARMQIAIEQQPIDRETDRSLPGDKGGEQRGYYRDFQHLCSKKVQWDLHNFPFKITKYAHAWICCSSLFVFLLYGA